MTARRTTPSFVATGLSALGVASLALLGPGTVRAQDPTGAPARGGELIGDEGGSSGPLPFNTCRKTPRGARFKFNLPKETELEDLVNWMMAITCQKFIWDRKVRSGKVTILSPEDVTIEEAYAAFYAALETMGLTVEPSGRYFKIVETTDAKNRTLPLYGDDANAPNSDRFVTQLVRVKHGSAKEIGDVLNVLRSKQGSVEIVGNLLIITDKGSSIRKLEKIVSELDVPAGTEKIFFYQLQYANAEEVAQIVRDIFGEKGGGDAGGRKGKGGSTAPSPNSAISRVIVDERSGTLIIVTN